MSEQPAPYTCKHRCERDELKDHIDALEAENKALRGVTHSLLNALSDNDDEGLMEHAEPVIRARALLAKEVRDGE